MDPVLSVIVVNWNTRDLLLACLASLRREAARVALEIIVVDNASADGSAEAAAAAFPETVLIRNGENRGFAAATNQGLARARGRYWALLNPDAEVTPGALAELASELDRRPEIWAAGPKLLNADGSLQPSGRRFPTPARSALQGLLPARLKRTAWWRRRVFGRVDFDVPARVDEVSGACLVARREAYARVGLLDERFFLFFEEVDWCLRLARAGGQIWYLPAAQVIHRWGAGMSQMLGESVLHNYRSEFRYWRKHGGRSVAVLMRAAVLVQALAWIAGRSALTLLGAKPRSELAPRLNLYGRVVLLALGLSYRSSAK